MITIKSFEFNYFQENTFLLYDDTREAVLIDCGCCRKEEEKELTDFILENKLTLKHLLCTHLHVDHVFGNGFIYKTYGLKPEANKQDVEKLPSPDEQAKLFGLRQHVENVPVEKYIVGGETIKFGTSELQVLTVPGHSPGSVAFYNKKKRLCDRRRCTVCRKYRSYRPLGWKPGGIGCRHPRQTPFASRRDSNLPGAWTGNKGHR